MEKINFSKDNKFIRTLLFIWVILQIVMVSFIYVQDMNLRSIHVMFVLVLSFLLLKDGKESNLIKIILAGLSVFTFSYIIINYPIISQRGAYTENLDLFVAGLSLILILYLGFKVNKNLFYLVLFFLSYLYWGKFLSGPLAHGGFSIKRILNYFVWGNSGIFGISVGVCASYIFLFVVFGSFLKYSGFSDFINDISLALIGSTTGGPAKVAVLASALMGMINGSAVANVAATGTITIPMMKKLGYSKEFSAAVEAVASTGGQFCPPIMGAAAFVMAEFLQIPYIDVVKVAIIPAFLYYLSLILAVHLEAKKLNLKTEVENKDYKKILKARWHLLIPLFLLLFMMAKSYSPIDCAVYGIFATIISSYLNKETAMSLKDIVDAAVDGASSALKVCVACILIGLIIGTVSLTGLGLNFGGLVLSLVKSTNIYFGAFMVMILSVVLGVGVPGVAAYVIVVSVAVPILIKCGASPIAAHLFCMIYACLANITPPVAISSYVASSIARSDMFKTSMIAIRLGLAGFILPFFFINNEALLLQSGEFLVTIRIILGAVVGILAITFANSGYLFKKEKYLNILLFIGGILFIDPNLKTDIISIIIITGLILFERKFSHA